MTYYESLEAAAEKNPNLNDVIVLYNGEEISLRKKWGLWLKTGSPDVGKAEPETNLVYVPASDKVLNLTRALDGKVHYKKRTIQMDFKVLRPHKQWENIRSELETLLQGQWLTFHFAQDPSWVWTGLFECSLTPGQTSAAASITATCNPYKTSATAAAGDDWLWDTFNFETDTIYDTPTEVGRL